MFTKILSLSLPEALDSSFLAVMSFLWSVFRVSLLSSFSLTKDEKEERLFVRLGDEAASISANVW